MAFSGITWEKRVMMQQRGNDIQYDYMKQGGNDVQHEYM